ncbi:MAG: tripartite tricarboxylate transporter TctB family protein [Chromatiaceae bacterium]|nr:tripartite tricarboxylate transporter TctB family protein [Chromatiaceae bacterium]MCP5423198.1 tripartite tricarboxylate transporter TctB family protein [Chromatiaceae bacterium]
MNLSELFEVRIVFEQSHLFFPRIIHWLLLFMLVLIAVFQGIPYYRAVRAGRKTLPFTSGPFDATRFFGTLILTVAYFVAMPYVGDLFPNTGLGFLLMSIPYMFVLSWLYLHERDRSHLLRIGINSIVAPVIAWYVLARLFNITLP